MFYKMHLKLHILKPFTKSILIKVKIMCNHTRPQIIKRFEYSVKTFVRK